jgi:hypothetical protein
MKTNQYVVFLMMALMFAIGGCKDENVEQPNPTVLLETNFNNGADGWQAVYAAYPEADADFYELVSGIKPLPTPLDQTKSSFLLSGNNHSDALQMFVVKQLSGLAPKTNYLVETEVELASKYPDGSVGIGGSPGNSVNLVAKFATMGYTLEKGKSSNIELTLKKVEATPESVLNMDLGDVSTPSDQYVYQLISRKKASTPEVIQSDQDGKLWAVIGTWSGFEGISFLFYTKIKITLTKK